MRVSFSGVSPRKVSDLFFDHVMIAFPIQIDDAVISPSATVEEIISLLTAKNDIFKVLLLRKTDDDAGKEEANEDVDEENENYLQLCMPKAYI